MQVTQPMEPRRRVNPCPLAPHDCIGEATKAAAVWVSCDLFRLGSPEKKALLAELELELRFGESYILY